MDKARETAMKVLYAVHENGAYANVALVEAFRKLCFDDLERRFVTELVYGAVKAGDTTVYEAATPQNGSIRA